MKLRIIIAAAAAVAALAVAPSAHASTFDPGYPPAPGTPSPCLVYGCQPAPPTGGGARPGPCYYGYCQPIHHTLRVRVYARHARSFGW